MNVVSNCLIRPVAQPFTSFPTLKFTAKLFEVGRQIVLTSLSPQNQYTHFTLFLWLSCILIFNASINLINLYAIILHCIVFIVNCIIAIQFVGPFLSVRHEALNKYYPNESSLQNKLTSVFCILLYSSPQVNCSHINSNERIVAIFWYLV